MKKPSRYIQIHHVHPEAYGHETLEDLVGLCAECHEYVELKTKVVMNTKNPVKPQLIELLKPYVGCLQ